MVKRSLFLLLVLVMLSGSALYSAKKITKLGVHPFHASKNLTADDLYQLATELAGDVKMGFDKAGNGDLFLPFLDQLKAAKIDMVQIQPGDSLQWMMFRSGKKVYVGTDLVWRGRLPFKAYRFFVYKDYRAYEFIVPLICGNITLKGVKGIPVPKCALTVTPARVEISQPVTIDVCGAKDAVSSSVEIIDGSGNVVDKLKMNAGNCKKTYTFPASGTYKIRAVAIGEYGQKSSEPCVARAEVWKNSPPLCELTCTPENPLHHQLITLDASASSDSDGKVTAVDFRVIDASGNVVEQKKIDTAPFIHTLKLKPGSYQIKVDAIDDFGARLSSDSCQKALTVAKGGSFLVDLGVIYMWDPAVYIPIRFGYQHKFSRQFSVTGVAGVAPVISGQDDTSAVLADVVFSYHPGRFYIGAGAGIFSSSRDTRFDFVFHTGYHLTDNIKGANFAIFIEGRSAFDEFDILNKRGRLGGGLRILF